MYLYGYAEYRGKNEKRSSKTGKSFYLLKFEDLDSGDQMSLYMSADWKFKIAPNTLKRGELYDIVMSYDLNTYDNKWNLTLCDIIGVHKEKQMG